MDRIEARLIDIRAKDLKEVEKYLEEDSGPKRRFLNPQVKCSKSRCYLGIDDREKVCDFGRALLC